MARVREVLGGIDLDPASSALANECVQAERYYTAEDDGLRMPWSGRIYLNPPYGYAMDARGKQRSSQALWSRKMIHEYESGHITQAILLVNAAIGEAWFWPLWRYAIAFPRRRIRFIGQGRSPTKGNAFVYFGADDTAFVRVFEGAECTVRSPHATAISADNEKGGGRYE